MEYFFSLPKITDLTIEQQAVLYEELPIAVSGGAGTGKSVVSIYRHLQNYDLGKSSRLITYTKTLQKYLFQSIRQINPEASKRVHSAKGCLISKNRQFCDGVDEIIIDEAQDLPRKDLEVLKSFANNISYGADFQQIMYIFKDEKNLSLKEIQEKRKKEFEYLFPKNIKPHLKQNFRNTKEIINFTRAKFPTFNINSDIEKRGKKPTLYIGRNQINKILELIEIFSKEAENTAILLPFTNDVDYFFNNLKDKISCSYYHNNLKDEYFTIQNIHITTFKSSKGLEFNTVIIPDFHNFDYNIKNMDTVTENDYYVAFTRAKRNLFLISSKDIEIDKNTCNIEEF